MNAYDALILLIGIQVILALGILLYLAIEQLIEAVRFVFQASSPEEVCDPDLERIERAMQLELIRADLEAARIANRDREYSFDELFESDPYPARTAERRKKTLSFDEIYEEDVPH